MRGGNVIGPSTCHYLHYILHHILPYYTTLSYHITYNHTFYHTTPHYIIPHHITTHYVIRPHHIRTHYVSPHRHLMSHLVITTHCFLKQHSQRSVFILFIYLLTIYLPLHSLVTKYLGPYSALSLLDTVNLSSR